MSQQMNQSNEVNIVFGGDKLQYYKCRGELYTATFPIEWAKNHLPNTGPTECGNCFYFGSWNGVFIGYCANCAYYCYNGERGCGFIGLGKENVFEHDEKYTSVFESYLKDVKLDQIGDKSIMDSENIIMIEEINAYADTLFKQVTEKTDLLERYSYGSNYDGGYDSY
jgi:hypothetical protein